VKKNLGYALAVTALTLSIAMPVASLAETSSSAVEGKTGLADKTAKATNWILTRIIPRDFGLDEREERAKNFNPQFTTEAPPIIDGDRIFSKDPATRKAAHDEYASFLEREGSDIARLKERRDLAVRTMNDTANRYEGLLQVIEKTPAAIERTSDLPFIDTIMTPLLKDAVQTAKQNQPKALSLLNEHRRIADQFDKLVEKAEMEHEAHAKTLETIDAILGINRPKVLQDKPTDTPHPSLGGTPATSASVTAGDRIRGAINGATAQVDAHASQSQTRLSTEQRQMGPIRPMPSQQELDAPAQQAPPDFKATMTPEPNSN
jgi:hypothetical protein